MAALVLVTGCGSTTDGSYDTGGCSLEWGEVALDDASKIGFSGQQVMDWFGQTRTGMLTYADEFGLPAAGVTLGAEHDGSQISYALMEPLADADCASYLYLRVLVSFSTSDGLLEGEDLATWIMPTTLEALDLRADIDRFEQETVFDLEPWDEGHGDVGTLKLSLAGDAMTGEVWSDYGHPEDCMKRDEEGRCVESGGYLLLGTFEATPD